MKMTCLSKGIFFFDPADRIYGEHFPGNPVVPGSVIVNAFLERAKEAGTLPGQIIVRDFRFKEFVIPGEHAFSIEIMSDQIRCRLYRGNSHESDILVTGYINK